MNRVVVRPYMTASSGVAFDPIAFAMADIDVQTPISIATRFHIEPDEVRSECGLPEGCRLAVILAVHCDLTLWSGHSTIQVEGGGAVEGSLEVVIPGGHAAGAVAAECAVILAEPLARTDPFVAFAEGSVLYRGPQGRQLLGGEGSHFPTDALSFEAAGRERGARWSVEYLYDTLDEPLLAGIRLLINTDTQAWNALNSTASDPLHRQLGTELRRYVLSDMVRRAVEDEYFTGGVVWPEGSVGKHFDDVIRTYGRGRSVEQLRSIRDFDRARFEEVLQALEADLP